MCGIAGIVGCGIGEPGSLLRSMISLLSHRGPDDEGIWDGPGVVLGHRRLSILDLSSAGRQPMVSHDQRYHIIFNGEIYNYLELRDQLSSYGYTFRTQTDTEVLLGAFERWGEDCVTRLNGMWAFAIWDGEEQRLFASRDRFGKKPFYYTVHRETFLFASEMKALLLVPGLTRTLNPEAVIDFAAERRLAHGERTWIQEIQQLPAASMLLLSHGQINIRPYWSLPLPDEEQGPTRKPRIEMISALLEDAVRVRLRADTPVGCLVSGGLDSSTVASLMRRLEPAGPIHVFTTLTEPRTEEASGVDVLLNQGRFIPHFHTPDARSFWDDLPMLLWHQELPFADGSMAAHYALMREARRCGVPVLLTGQGADEVFAGYPSYLWAHLGEAWRQGSWRLAWRQWRDATRWHQCNYARVAYHMMPQAVQQVAKQTYLQRSVDWVNRDLISSSFGQRSFVRRNFMEQELPSFLHYEDRNSMAFGIETRLPFLDYRLVETLVTVPFAEKACGMQLKGLLRAIATQWVPAEITQRFSKQGYPAPLNRWLRTLRTELLDVAHSSITRTCPLLRPTYWQREVERFMREEGRPLEPVWRGLISVLWYRNIFERDFSLDLPKSHS